jgi:hypothetical protein
MMLLGRANEIAGRFDRARVAYEEMMRAELACWEMVTFTQFAKSECAKPFVYLCLKLGRELDKSELVMSAIKFHPRVAPFGTEDGQSLQHT